MQSHFAEQLAYVLGYLILGFSYYFLAAIIVKSKKRFSKFWSFWFFPVTTVFIGGESNYYPIIMYLVIGLPILLFDLLILMVGLLVFVVWKLLNYLYFGF